MPSRIASQKITAKNKEEFMIQVEKAMQMAEWKKYVKGKRIFVKPNCLSDQVVPGQCTSPWVLEGVLKVLTEKTDARIYVGDSDVATSRQFEPMIRNWGFDKICKKYRARLVNLSKQRLIWVKVGGNIFKRIQVPEILTKVDCIVTIPVIKTHNVTTMTCALKNQWGCLTRVRHQYHLKADQCIAEINKFLKVTFVVADGTICLEDSGPRVGMPKIMNYIFATNDRVAMDALACDLMKIDKKKVGQIKWGKRLGIGTLEYKIKGDKVIPKKFKPAKLENHPIVRTEIMLRQIPFVEWLLFKTPLFKIPAWIASKYNSFWWYNLRGKKYAREIIKKRKIYTQEFNKIIK